MKLRGRKGLPTEKPGNSENGHEKEEEEARDSVIVAKRRQRPRSEVSFEGGNINKPNSKRSSSKASSSVEEKSGDMNAKRKQLRSSRRNKSYKSAEESSSASEINSDSTASKNSTHSLVSSQSFDSESKVKSNDFISRSPTEMNVKECTVVILRDTFTESSEQNKSSSDADKSSDLALVSEGGVAQKENKNQTKVMNLYTKSNIENVDIIQYDTSDFSSRKTSLRSNKKSSNKKTQSPLKAGNKSSKRQSNNEPTLADWLATARASSSEEDVIDQQPVTAEKSLPKTRAKSSQKPADKKKSVSNGLDTASRSSSDDLGIGGDIPSLGKPTSISTSSKSKGKYSYVSSPPPISSIISPPLTSRSIAKDSLGHSPILTSMRKMKEINMQTPQETSRRGIGRIASTPQCASSSEEDLFGFENLLHPIPDVLEDVTPIINHQVPKIHRKKKVSPFYKEKNKSKKRDSIPNFKNVLPVNVSSSHSRRSIDRINQGKIDKDLSEIHLFEDTPEPEVEHDEYCFEDEPSPSKPKKNRLAANKKVHNLPHPKFNIEDQLPWKEINEHELVIESV